MAIYNWWVKERAIELNKEYNKLTEWSAAKREGAENTQDLWKELRALEGSNSAKLEEMLHRLLTVRHCLWT